MSDLFAATEEETHMPDRKIPCERCQSEKEKVERGRRYEVVSCEPTTRDPKKCKLIYRRKSEA
jgi:hypothetical protein